MSGASLRPLSDVPALARAADVIVVVPSVDEPGPHSCRRQFEWTAAVALFGFGLWIALVPGSVPASRFSPVMMLIGYSELALACIVFGGLHAVVLYMNGGLFRWGPRLRALLSSASAFMWAQIAIALYTPIDPSPGVWIYAVLAGSEIVTVLRAGRDLNGIASKR